MKYITWIKDTNTTCEFAYVICNADVCKEYEYWKKKNPGPYEFWIEEHGA